jgi:hypothetical protein
VKQFQKQFHKDFSLFLKLRHEELVHGGQMVLIFLGRKNEDVYNGDLNQLFALVARALQSLVSKVVVYVNYCIVVFLLIFTLWRNEVKRIVIITGPRGQGKARIFQSTGLRAVSWRSERTSHAKPFIQLGSNQTI